MEQGMQDTSIKRHVWLDPKTDMVIASLYLTHNAEGIGICANGKCVTRPPEEWVRLAWEADAQTALLEAWKALAKAHEDYSNGDVGMEPELYAPIQAARQHLISLGEKP